jgi:hypothetical protein
MHEICFLLRLLVIAPSRKLAVTTVTDNGALLPEWTPQRAFSFAFSHALRKDMIPKRYMGYTGIHCLHGKTRGYTGIPRGTVRFQRVWAKGMGEYKC